MQPKTKERLSNLRRHNRKMPRRRVDIPVETSEDHGVDGDSIEAAAFAWLAARTLDGAAGNEPAVTGAVGPRTLGAIYRA